MPEAWENAGNRHTIYFSFESDWLKRWREFSGPVTWRSKAKIKQSWIAFNTRLKIAQCQGHLFKVGAELIMQTILNVGEERVQFFQVGRAFSPIWAKRTGKSRITSIFISLLSRKNVSLCRSLRIMVPLKKNRTNLSALMNLRRTKKQMDQLVKKLLM